MRSFWILNFLFYIFKSNIEFILFDLWNVVFGFYGVLHVFGFYGVLNVFGFMYII